MKKKEPKKIGVALSGGSSWGVAHVGAITVLEEQKIPIDCIAGTSAGSVVGALYAFGVPISEIYDIAKKIEWNQISKFAYSTLGVRTNESLAKMLTDILGPVKIEDAKIPLAIVATNIESGKEMVFRTGNVAQAVRASSAIPGYFTPVEVDGALYVDGLLTENLPISPLKDLGATFTIGVNLTHTMDERRPKHAVNVIERSFGILMRRDQALSSLVDILIEPKVSAFNSRSFDNVEDIYNAGFQAAKHAMPAVREKLGMPAGTPTFFEQVLQYLKLQ